LRVPKASAAARRRRAFPTQSQALADKGDHVVESEGIVLKGRRNDRSPGPQKGRRTHPKGAKRSTRNVTILAAELKRAEGLLARGRREVKRLREIMPWSPSRRLSQLLLANFEALLSLQIAHRGYLLRQLREAKGSGRTNGRTHKAQKGAVTNGLARRAQKTRTAQARR
jgi:hypothetical protein